MTIAEFMVLAAALIPYIAVGYAKHRSAKNFDNADPRNLSHFDAESMRAYNAQLNGFEIFPFFAAAVVIAEFHGVSYAVLSILSALFVASRIFYTLAYIKNKAMMRSPLFSVGLLITIGIFLLPFLQ